MPAYLTNVTPYLISSTPITRPVEVSLPIGKQAQVFLFKGQGANITSISEIGATATGHITKVLGLELLDQLKAVTTDGSMFASQVVTSIAVPLELKTAAWRPQIEAKPVITSEVQAGKAVTHTSLSLTIRQVPSDPEIRW